VCDGDYWGRDEAVMFKHVDTGDSNQSDINTTTIPIEARGAWRRLISSSSLIEEPT
jgi:hypothetical protein